jgi:hypothetical protein
MLLLSSFFSTNLEIVISTEAAHGLIMSSAVEKSAVTVAFRLCLFFAGHPQQVSVLAQELPPNHPSDIQSQTPTKIPASQSEENAHRRWRRNGHPKSRRQHLAHP